MYTGVVNLCMVFASEIPRLHLIAKELLKVANSIKKALRLKE